MEKTEDQIKEEKLKNFNCKICYDLVNEPIVTQCGHLYCWNCIYTWYEQKQNNNIFPCPICISDVDINKVIPIYISMKEHKNKRTIPKRPKPNNSQNYNNNNNINRNNFYINFMGFGYNFNLNNNRFGRFLPIICFFVFPILFFFITSFFDYLFYDNKTYFVTKNGKKLYYEFDNYDFYIDFLLPLIIFVIFSFSIILFKFIKNNIRRRNY